MLFAISGSQGSGKSSVLRELESRGFEVMQRKISRSILHDWGVTLDEVNSQPDLTLKFQDEILVRKFKDEESARVSSDIIFTERTFMDSFTYYMYSFGSKTEFAENINEYYKKCVYYDSFYEGVFLLPFGQFDIEADGIRNSNHLYAESVNVVLRTFLRKVIFDLHEVKELSIIDRADYIEKNVKNNKKVIDNMRSIA